MLSEKIDDMLSIPFNALNSGIESAIDAYKNIMDYKYYLWYKTQIYFKKDICKGMYIGYKNGKFCRISGKFYDKNILKKLCPTADIQKIERGNVHYYCYYCKK